MFDRMFDNNDTASLSSSSTQTGNTQNETANKENLDPKLGEVVEDEQTYWIQQADDLLPKQ